MAGPATIPLISAGLSLGSSAFGAITAGKEARRARRQEQRAKKEAKRLEEIYANLDTSNPYLNMENTMEDLTVNQQQAQFQAQQLQQSQANVLGQLRGAAGRSGIGALAQALVQQGQIGAQKASATIGAQEAANQRLAAREASRVQTLERKGEILSRNMRRDQVGTLLGMQQQRLGAARLQRAAAQRAKMQAIASGITGVTSALATGMQTGAFDKQPVTDVVEDTATNVVADTVTGKRLPLSPLLPQIQGPQTAAQAGYNEGVQGTFYNTGASYFGPNQGEYATNVYQPTMGEIAPVETISMPMSSQVSSIGAVPPPQMQVQGKPISLPGPEDFSSVPGATTFNMLYPGVNTSTFPQGYSPQTFTNIYGPQGVNQAFMAPGLAGAYDFDIGKLDPEFMTQEEEMQMLGF